MIVTTGARTRTGSSVTRRAYAICDHRPGARRRCNGRHDARVWIDFTARILAPCGETMRYGAGMALRIPAVLAFTVVGATAAAALSCGGNGAPAPDAMVCPVVCVAHGSGSNGCTPPTCATGSNHDMCPAGCVAVPIG
jgi:hypothetical protein